MIVDKQYAQALTHTVSFLQYASLERVRSTRLGRVESIDIEGVTVSRRM
jgi:hypothetical protein